MKLNGIVCSTLAAAIACVSWFAISSTMQQRKPCLYVYTWSDYFDPELIAQFENDNKCKVEIDTFDSNEAAFAKLAAGATGYDIITPTTYFIPTMRKAGIITDFDTNLIPNVVANFDWKYSNLSLTTNLAHSVPYSLSMTGIMYKKGMLPPGLDMDAAGWNAFTNPAFRGRSSILNDPREVIGCSLRTMGFSANSTNWNELCAALETSKSWKRCIAKFDNEQYKTAVAGGEFAMAMAYNSDAMQMVQDDDDIGFSIPKCGTTCSFDEFCLSSTSRNPGLAHAFVDFMYNPTNAARNVEYVFAIMPVVGIEKLVDANLKGRNMVFPPSETLSRCELLTTPSAETLKAHVKFWDELKLSK